jgi:NADPH-dependent curcumin reductase
MSKRYARQIVLAARPRGRVQFSDFQLRDVAVPTPGDGEMLLQVHYLLGLIAASLL